MAAAIGFTDGYRCAMPKPSKRNRAVPIPPTPRTTRLKCGAGFPDWSQGGKKVHVEPKGGHPGTSARRNASPRAAFKTNQRAKGTAKRFPAAPVVRKEIRERDLGHLD